MPFEMDSTISIHAPREGGDVVMDLNTHDLKIKNRILFAAL